MDSLYLIQAFHEPAIPGKLRQYSKRDLWRANSGCLHREVDYRTRLVVAVAMGAIALVFQ
jgi:hypothetical protein